MVNDPTKTRAGGHAGQTLYRPSTAGCLDDAIGEHGLSEAELARWLERLAPAIARRQEDYRTRRLPHVASPRRRSTSPRPRRRSPGSPGGLAIIFFGTGGSSLGGLAQLGGWHIPGTADEAQKMRPRTRFYDNLDGHTLASALHSFDDLGEARFIVISKSGGTPETLVQAHADA